MSFEAIRAIAAEQRGGSESMSAQQSPSGPPMETLHREVAEGLLYVHARLTGTSRASLEAASFLYALIELLNEKGLLSIADLDQRKEVVAQRLVQKHAEQRVGVLMQDPELDKYTFEAEAKIDCENRVQFCKAACCRLPFALSR